MGRAVVLRRAALALGSALGVAALAGCGGPDVTAPRLDAAVAGAFSHLYAQQQVALGHRGATAGWIRASASCSPPGSAGAAGASGSATGGVGHAGAGEWACAVTWRAWDGTVTTADYDLTTRPEGCYTASGPAALVGPAELQRPDGSVLTNPVLAFDGCFDPTR